MRTHWQSFSTFLLFPPILLLFALALQYPLSTSFPIGGDAAAHIRVANTLLDFRANPKEALTTITSSNYPLHDILFAGTSILPISWPERFTWWITASHILTGIALGFFLARLAGAPAAAAGIAIWALTPIGINPHFEDGTAPQLLSLVFLILTLERIHANSIIGTLLFLAATHLLHPLSGLIIFASLAFGTLVLLPVRAQLTPKQTRLIKYASLLILSLAAFTAFQLFRGYNWPNLELSGSRYFILDMLKSKFSPWLILGLAGLARLIRKLKYALPTMTGLLSFFWFSFILTNNSALHLGVWENRFHTYFVLAVAITAALSLPALLKAAFAGPLGRVIFTALLFASLASITWRDNLAVYRYYDNPDNHASLHPEVQTAFHWLRDNLPPDSFIATSAASRFTEWTPVLTERSWEAINAASPLLTQQGDSLYQAAQSAPYTHILFLTDHEDINIGIAAHPEWFTRIYENPAAVVFTLP